MDKEKEFYGSVSFAGRADFNLKAANEDEATKIVFDDILYVDLILKDGSKLTIDEVQWDLIEKQAQGNCSEHHIRDFEICEEQD